MTIAEAITEILDVQKFCEQAICNFFSYNEILMGLDPGVVFPLKRFSVGFILLYQIMCSYFYCFHYICCIRFGTR